MSARRAGGHRYPRVYRVNQVLREVLAEELEKLADADERLGLATVTGVTAAVQQAGAVVTGQAELQPSFFDTSTNTESSLSTLAGQVKPPTVALGVQTGQTTANAKIAGQQNAAQVLAPALVTKIGADLPVQQTKKIVDGFAAQAPVFATGEGDQRLE